MIEGRGDLTGEKLKPGDTFQFRCHPGVPCFNSCCRDKRLPLMPYDMLRLRRGLNLPSQDILAQYVELEMDPVSGWPALRLRLDEEGWCPLLTEKGCGVYPHRPCCCRIYPISRAAGFKSGRSGEIEELYFLEKPPNCRGWEEPQTLGIEAWVEDQGLPPYHQANDELLGLFMHPKRRGRLELDQRQIHAVILGLYNQDVFAEMIKQKKLATRLPYKPDNDLLAEDEDVRLLRIGRDWLIKLLFGG